MRSGKLRTYISIERQVQMGVSSLNQPQFVWQVWREPFADLEVRRGREQFDPQTKQRYSEEVYRFCVRYDEVTGIDASMHVVHEGSTYDIKAILPDKLHRSDCVIECTLQDSVLEGAALMGFIVRIPDGTVGEVYGGFTVEVKGGRAPYSFQAESGSLPPGLALNASTGAVSGTPAVAGTYSGIDLQVTDADGAVSPLPPFTITIDEG